LEKERLEKLGDLGTGRGYVQEENWRISRAPLDLQTPQKLRGRPGAISV
jgi:hypothetical protein